MTLPAHIVIFLARSVPLYSVLVLLQHCFGVDMVFVALRAFAVWFKVGIGDLRAVCVHKGIGVLTID